MIIIFQWKLPLLIPEDYFLKLIKYLMKLYKKYQKKIKVYFPDHEAVENMVQKRDHSAFTIQGRTGWSAAGSENLFLLTGPLQE